MHFSKTSYVLERANLCEMLAEPTSKTKRKRRVETRRNQASRDAEDQTKGTPKQHAPDPSGEESQPKCDINSCFGLEKFWIRRLKPNKPILGP